MTEQNSLLTPPITFLGANSATPPAKRVILLESLLPPTYAPLTLPARIIGCEIWNQMAGDYPAGCSGDVSVALDPGRHYITKAGFPTTENCQPFLLETLGVLEFMPGKSHDTHRPFNPPIVYHAGDGIVFAPEVGGAAATQFSIYCRFDIEAEGDFPLLSGIVLDMPSDKEATGTYCTRLLIPSIASGGSQVAVHVTAGASGCVLTHMSAGIQASGSTMTATPAQLLFGAAAGVTLPAGGDAWFVGTLATTSGQSLLINAETAGAYPYRDVLPAGVLSWYSTTANYNSATMSGAATAAHGYVVDCVRVM